MQEKYKMQLALDITRFLKLADTQRNRKDEKAHNWNRMNRTSQYGWLSFNVVRKEAQYHTGMSIKVNPCFYHKYTYLRGKTDHSWYVIAPSTTSIYTVKFWHNINRMSCNLMENVLNIHTFTLNWTRKTIYTSNCLPKFRRKE